MAELFRDAIKRDRTARLLRVAHLLYAHPHGLTAAEIARRVEMSIRTVYRDLHALEEELKIPVWQQEGRWGTESKAFLPPLKLTLHEAVALFLSARLFARFADKRDDHVLSAFDKLATVLPPTIAQHVQATITALQERPRDATYSQVLEALETGWAQGRKVRIWYPYQHPDGRVFTNERLVAPYFLEPHPRAHACYLIAHDSYTQALRTFKVERIQRAALTDERFEVPADFDPYARFNLAWGIVDEPPVEVRLRFHDPAAASRAREAHWHPSQRAITHPDGSLELVFTVAGLLEITPWILEWGDAVEVLAPPELRARVAAVARALVERYGAQDELRLAR